MNDSTQSMFNTQRRVQAEVPADTANSTAWQRGGSGGAMLPHKQASIHTHGATCRLHVGPCKQDCLLTPLHTQTIQRSPLVPPTPSTLIYHFV